MENKNNTEYNYKIFETLEKVKPLHVIILLAILFGIGWVMNNEEQKDYEINEPRKFLRVDNTSGKGGIFESYVSGTITNTSNNTTYGEIEVELELFSESKKSISIENRTIKQNIRPNDFIEFKLKFSKSGVRNFHVTIIDAEVINQN